MGRAVLIGLGTLFGGFLIMAALIGGLRSAPGAVAERPVRAAPAPNTYTLLSHRDDREHGVVRVVGEVRNDGERPGKFVKVVATFYDRMLRVVGVADSFLETSGNTIAPHEKAPFKILTSAVGDYASYELKIVE